MYIALLFVATIIFSVQFAANAGYSRNEGGALPKAMMLALLSGSASCVVLMLTTGAWSFTWFSFALALLSSLACVTMMCCSVKVLTQGDLSVYALFSQMGGMLLPSLAGILVYGEPLTWQRGLCMALVIAATIIGRPPKARKADKNQPGAIRWYLGVFVLNGIWCVLAKVHQSAPELAVSGSMYSLMICLLNVLISSTVLLTLHLRRGERLTLVKPRTSCTCALLNGALNITGNLILLEALLHVDASIQYPVVTGGMMVLTVVIDRISGRRPTTRTLASTAVAVAGLILLAL